MKDHMRTRLYNFADSYARKLHPAILRLFSMPINYQIKSKDNIVYENARMIDIAFAFCMNNKIEGDYAEFGVFRGKTTIEAWRARKRYNFSERCLWIFDSFAGLPEIVGEDIGGPFIEGEFACSRPEFEENLRRFKVDISKVNIIEGFYDKTLVNPSFDVDKIAIAFIDCDLYESTVPVLNFLTDKLVNGAVLIFDDWYCFDGGERKGEQLACAEWLKANPNIRLIEYQNFHWGGKSFIFNRL